MLFLSWRKLLQDNVNALRNGAAILPVFLQS
jgi:hypothetical protein